MVDQNILLAFDPLYRGGGGSGGSDSPTADDIFDIKFLEVAATPAHLGRSVSTPTPPVVQGLPSLPPPPPPPPPPLPTSTSTSSSNSSSGSGTNLNSNSFSSNAAAGGRRTSAPVPDNSAAPSSRRSVSPRLPVVSAASASVSDSIDTTVAATYSTKESRVPLLKPPQQRQENRSNSCSPNPSSVQPTGAATLCSEGGESGTGGSMDDSVGLRSPRPGFQSDSQLRNAVLLTESNIRVVPCTPDPELYLFSEEIQRIQRNECQPRDPANPAASSRPGGGGGGHFVNSCDNIGCIFNHVNPSGVVFVTEVPVTLHFAGISFDTTWSLSSKVEDVMFSLLFDSALSDRIASLYGERQMDVNQFLLRICGRDEYLRPDEALRSHSVFQETCRCQRYEFSLERISDIRDPRRFLGRSKEDLEAAFHLPAKYSSFSCDVDSAAISQLLNEFLRQKQALLSGQSQDSSLTHLIQIVKFICTKCGNLILPDILRYINDIETIMKYHQHELPRNTLVDKLELLQESLLQQVNLFCFCWSANYHFCCEDAQLSKISTWDTPYGCCQAMQEEQAGSFHEYFYVCVSSLHRLPGNDSLSSRYSKIKVSCELHHGEKRLDDLVSTEAASLVCPMECESLKFYDWRESAQLTFDRSQVSSLPRETVLSFTLFGQVHSSEPTPETFRNNEAIGWVRLRLFDAKGALKQGSYLLPMWNDRNKASWNSTCETNMCHQDANSCTLLLHVRMPNYRRKGDNQPLRIVFPPADWFYDSKLYSGDWSGMDPMTGEDIDNFHRIVNRKFTESQLTDKDRTIVLSKRSIFLANFANSLPQVLLSFPSYKSDLLPQIYRCLTAWQERWTSIDQPADTPLAPLLQLLGPEFADIEVREFAVRHLFTSLQPDEMERYLPQMTQALLCQPHLCSTSLLCRLLIMSVHSPAFASTFYWQLKLLSNLDSRHQRRRLTLISAALRHLCGACVETEWAHQEQLIDALEPVAVRLQTHKSVEQFRDELCMKIQPMLSRWSHFRLPHDMSLLARSISIPRCSFFSSKTMPLRLVFQPFHESDAQQLLSVIYKKGDNLSIDALCLQMTYLFNLIWRKEGLDLRMLLFRVFPTSADAGFVELVTDCKSLKNIHLEFKTSFGAACVFDWLRKHNRTESELSSAVDTFTRSLAGWLVITYVLGVCDRHNDNIMLCHTGHLFHIDFAKLLGDSEKFLGVSRDRVPMVFTKDMFYAINGGTLAVTPRYFQFITHCVDAFNILRRNSILLLTMIKLMLPANIPRFNLEGIEYVQARLELSLNELQAGRKLTVLLDKCLRDDSAELNFRIHTMFNPEQQQQQQSQSSPSTETLRHSIRQDGEIVEVTAIRALGPSMPDSIDVRVRSSNSQQQQQQQLQFLFSVRRRGGSTGRVQLSRDDIARFWTAARSAYPAVMSGQPFPDGLSKADTAEETAAVLESWLTDLLTVDGIGRSDLLYSLLHPNVDDSLSSAFYTDCEPQLGGEPGHRISLQTHGYGEQPSLKAGFLYEAKSETLYISVEYLTNLSSTAQLSGGSLYLKLYLLPGPDRRSKQKIRFCQDELSGRRNHFLVTENVVTYSLNRRELSHKQLSIAVWINPAIHSARELHRLCVPLSKYLDECVHYELLKFPAGSA
ncbi:hypothetical protein BOX15_Mlig013649g1 [Macrostomum lignano]|uniref:Phosphatidylinositol-4-phosphate 3-kinase n=1 Tax=Macrostomum lignano TaxID=282301 RepID=A0A267G4L9_9PLAT|nr:hypothetical protein BOX15_Mlig013649g1 [Macrostomum lignano]